MCDPTDKSSEPALLLAAGSSIRPGLENWVFKDDLSSRALSRNASGIALDTCRGRVKYMATSHHGIDELDHDVISIWTTHTECVNGEPSFWFSLLFLFGDRGADARQFSMPKHGFGHLAFTVPVQGGAQVSDPGCDNLWRSDPGWETPLLLVTDSSAQSVHVLCVVSETRVGLLGPECGLQCPRGIAASLCGTQIAVTDNQGCFQVIRVFHGRNAHWTGHAVIRRDSLFKHLFGLRFTSDGGSVVVADRDAGQVLQLSITNDGDESVLVSGLTSPRDVQFYPNPDKLSWCVACHGGLVTIGRAEKGQALPGVTCSGLAYSPMSGVLLVSDSSAVLEEDLRKDAIRWAWMFAVARSCLRQRRGSQFQSQPQLHREVQRELEDERQLHQSPESLECAWAPLNSDSDHDCDCDSLPGVGAADADGAQPRFGVTIADVLLPTSKPLGPIAFSSACRRLAVVEGSSLLMYAVHDTPPRKVDPVDPVDPLHLQLLWRKKHVFVPGVQRSAAFTVGPAPSLLITDRQRTAAHPDVIDAWDVDTPMVVAEMGYPELWAKFFPQALATSLGKVVVLACSRGEGSMAAQSCFLHEFAWDVASKVATRLRTMPLHRCLPRGLGCAPGVCVSQDGGVFVTVSGSGFHAVCLAFPRAHSDTVLPVGCVGVAPLVDAWAVSYCSRDQGKPTGGLFITQSLAPNVPYTSGALVSSSSKSARSARSAKSEVQWLPLPGAPVCMAAVPGQGMFVVCKQPHEVDMKLLFGISFVSKRRSPPSSR